MKQIDNIICGVTNSCGMFIESGEHKGIIYEIDYPDGYEIEINERKPIEEFNVKLIFYDEISEF